MEWDTSDQILLLYPLSYTSQCPFHLWSGSICVTITPHSALKVKPFNPAVYCFCTCTVLVLIVLVQRRNERGPARESRSADDTIYPPYPVLVQIGVRSTVQVLLCTSRISRDQPALFHRISAKQRFFVLHCLTHRSCS